MFIALVLSLYFNDVLRINTYHGMPISGHTVAVDASGHIYYLDKDDKQVVVFDSEGEETHRISRPGQGVGDLQMPRRMFLKGDKLYILEDHYMNIFNVTGTFISKKRIPFTGHTLVMWFDGVWATYNNQFKNPDALELKFYNEAFEPFQETIRFPWERPFHSGGYDPAISRMNVVASPKQGMVYVVSAKKLKISVIDVHQRKIVNEMIRDKKPIPLNEPWADAKHEQMVENWKITLQRMGMDPANASPRPKAFPSHFPIVKRAYHDQEGNVVLDLWTPNPDKVFDLQAFDRQGHAVTLEYDHPDTYRRFIAQQNGFVYLWEYNLEDEESYIVRVKEDDVNAYTKAHPLKFTVRGQHMKNR